MFAKFWNQKRGEIPLNRDISIGRKAGELTTGDPASIIFDYLASQLTAAGLIARPGVIHKRYEHNYMVLSDNYLLGVICGMCKAVISTGTASLDESEQRSRLIALWYDTVMRLLGEQMGEFAIMKGKMNLVMPFDAVQEVDPNFATGVLHGGNEAIQVLAGQKPSRSYLHRKAR